MRSGRVLHAASLLILLAATAAARAQTPPAPDAGKSDAGKSDAGKSAPASPDVLAATLRKVRDSGQIVLGYRSYALPFSYLDRRGVPVGYSLDICREIAADVVTALGESDLKTVLREVRVENEFAKLADGEVDLICSATTVTPERRQKAAFTPAIFNAGARLLVRKDAPIKGLADLAGHTVVATAGSTTLAALTQAIAAAKLDVHVVTEPDASHAFARLDSGGADALALNDIALHSLIATEEGGKQYAIVGERLTDSPYAIAYRQNDPDFAGLVQASFARMASQGLLAAFYDRWFVKRLPSGQKIDVPMGAKLQQDFTGMGDSD
jgi:glutamate/aspartate transport system substrate-binding protein